MRMRLEERRKGWERMSSEFITEGMKWRDDKVDGKDAGKASLVY